ncbi:(2Fe-2S)-binding protein [Pacificimonas sp. ICDLI1SI03]
MYVCICNAIKETDLRAAARQCRSDAETIYASMGRPPQCRQCLDDAEEILAEARSPQNPPIRPAFACPRLALSA